MLCHSLSLFSPRFMRVCIYIRRVIVRVSAVPLCVVTHSPPQSYGKMALFRTLAGFQLAAVGDGSAVLQTKVRLLLQVLAVGFVVFVVVVHQNSILSQKVFVYSEPYGFLGN